MRFVRRGRQRQGAHLSPRAAWPNRGLAAGLVAAAVLLGWWLPHAERSHDLGGLSYDPAAAQATLGAIASGIIALTGFVLTAVTLVIQSVQSTSPRLAGVLGFFERSLVLFGALTGTAVYALVVLAQVGARHVPRLSVTLAIVFVVLSTGATLSTLAGLRQVITGGGLVRTVGRQLHTALDDAWYTPARTPSAPRVESDVVTATGSGVVQHIDGPAVAEALAGCGARVTCLTAVGSFVEPGAPLMRVTSGTLSEPVTRRLIRAVHLGPSRHIEHDPAYGLRLLVDIAIRALSPGINDPTTAVQALDQIEAVLLRFASRPLGPATVQDRRGVDRVVIPRPDWATLLDLALAEVLLYGAGSLQIQRRLRALLDSLTRVVPPSRTAALAPYRAVLDRAADTLPDAALTRSARVPDAQGLGGPAAADERTG
ncbi:DUF2254 family protein [Streptomyces sp. NPDC049954]|uniref:DUF2254 domain-containing protein n=1 Tax=Streptomyces sp. NPDC049954 TaxID=3155779 RepID=UPI003429B7E5